jgi:hypothetical protein
VTPALALPHWRWQRLSEHLLGKWGTECENGTACVAVHILDNIITGGTFRTPVDQDRDTVEACSLVLGMRCFGTVVAECAYGNRRDCILNSRRRPRGANGSTCRSLVELLDHVNVFIPGLHLIPRTILHASTVSRSRSEGTVGLLDSILLHAADDARTGRRVPNVKRRLMQIAIRIQASLWPHSLRALHRGGRILRGRCAGRYRRMGRDTAAGRAIGGIGWTAMTFAPGHRVKKPTSCVYSIERRALRNIQILVSSAFGRLRRLRRAPALCAELIALERMTGGVAQLRP